MTASQALTLYRPSSVTATNSSRSIVSSRLFTASTGTAIATELLYRILVELINRLLTSFQHFASDRMDRVSSWLEQRAQERRECQLEVLKAKKDNKSHKESSGDLQIVDEVKKLVEEKGFPPCPMHQHMQDSSREPPEWMKKRFENGHPGPPKWIRSIVEGWSDNKIEVDDIWMNTHTG